MVFSSLTFVAFFLPLVTVLYFTCRDIRWRNGILLVFSLLFYGWGEPIWILAMLTTVTINYFCALKLGRTENTGLKKLWLILGIGLSLGFLFYFKYFGFFLDNITGILKIEHGITAPALPIGISFYTFQVIAYTVDVYRGKVDVQKSYWKLLLYVSFFPQLIAGPIVNYKDIEGQLQERRIALNDFYEGMIRFFVGFGKKILLANTCGIVVEKIVAANELSVLGAWVMAMAYALQIYFDFSGYSDMAIGMGRMFGFHFLENFNHPYISESVTEFWRRWHISLGSFFREYVYIPLGGNRVSKEKLLRNIAIVWMLTGVWHGASWNFMMWGLYYGLLLILEKTVLFRIKEKLPKALNIGITLLFVLIGWVFFYYIDLSDGVRHLGIMFGLIKNPATDAVTVYYMKYYFVFLISGILACIPWKINTESKVWTIFKPILATIIFVMAMSVLIGQSYNPFLYFRF